MHEPNVPARPSSRPPSLSAGSSVLLVDDLPANLFALECVLAPLGHRLVRASSGQDALRRMLDEDFAVILMDLRLGDMTGVEVLKLLRTRERSRRTPVVLLTATDGDDPALKPAYELGPVDYLRKPLIPELLRAKVSLCVELHATRESLRRQELRARDLAAQLQGAHRELESLRAREAPPAGAPPSE